jgi:flavin-dependent thymidylate synthase
MSNSEKNAGQEERPCDRDVPHEPHRWPPMIDSFWCAGLPTLGEVVAPAVRRTGEVWGHVKRRLQMPISWADHRVVEAFPASALTTGYPFPEDLSPHRPMMTCSGVAAGSAHTSHNWTWTGELPTDGDPVPTKDFWCPGHDTPGGMDDGNGMTIGPADSGWRKVTPEEAEAEGFPMLEEVPENRKLPVRWADRAMFKAEALDASDGPRVYLLWMTPDPLGAIAAACKMYKGEVVRNLYDVTDAERLEYLQQVNKTKLKAPFEFVQFHFMIEGVTRGFTHQMVRQRTAAYAQESLRFAVIGEEDGDIPVRLPPSLSGLPMDSESLAVWHETVREIGTTYRRLVDSGVPAEDARGILPHNVLTRLHYTTNLRALLDHAGNRLCTQAQFEWRDVFAKIVDAIRGAHTIEMYKKAPDGQPAAYPVYMADQLTSLFRPVCYATGKCEFMANFDRECSIRERVQANHEIGRPSSEWGQEYHAEGGSGKPSVGAIKPGEWLLDHNAARRK